MNKTILAIGSAVLLAGQTLNAQSCPDVCDAEGLNSSLEWIQAVDIGGLFNFSGNDGGYADFGDDFFVSYTAGTTVFYTVAAGYSDGPFSESWQAWMDFNQDGDFDDPGEEIFDNFGQFQVSGSFSIPATAFNGSTKFRIAMGFGSFPQLCTDVNDGEIEDYCINIVGGVDNPDQCDASLPVTGLMSEVGATSVTLSWDAVPNSVGCRVSGGLSGTFGIKKNVFGAEVSSLTVPFSALSPGNVYSWKVVCACSIDPLVLTPDSDVDFFTVPTAISTQGSTGLSSMADMTLSPNPANNLLNVSVISASNATNQLIVTDLLGRTAMQKDVDFVEGFNSVQFDVTALSKGSYIMVLNNGNNGLQSVRFIKE